MNYTKTRASKEARCHAADVELKQRRRCEKAQESAVSYKEHARHEARWRVVGGQREALVHRAAAKKGVAKTCGEVQ